MKKLLLLTILLVGYNGYSQYKSAVVESKLICKSIDEFTDEVSLAPTEQVILYKDNGDMKSQGLVMTLFYKNEKGKVLPNIFYLKVVGLKGGCVDEGSTLDIIFENGDKTQLSNWWEFNCEGLNYFSIKGKEDLFKSTKIKAIKYTNKRDYESMIVKINMTEEGSSFLMNSLLEVDKINNGEVSLGTCKE